MYSLGMYQRFTTTNLIGSQQGIGDSRKGYGSKAPDTVANALLRVTMRHISQIEPSPALKRILYGKWRNRLG